MKKISSLLLTILILAFSCQTKTADKEKKQESTDISTPTSTPSTPTQDVETSKEGRKLLGRLDNKIVQVMEAVETLDGIKGKMDASLESNVSNKIEEAKQALKDVEESNITFSDSHKSFIERSKDRLSDSEIKFQAQKQKQ